MTTTPPPPPEQSRFIVSTYLLGQAKSLYRLIPASEDLRSSSAPALAAILLTAAALEAFINELAEWARVDRTPAVIWDGDVQYAGLLGDILAAAEDGRLDLQTKFEIAFRIMADRPMNRGEPPFQDLGLLIQVRNFLMHIKESEIGYMREEGSLTIPEAPILAKLRSKDIIAPVVEPAANRISTRAAARWAARACCRSVMGLLSAARPSEFKRKTEGFYRMVFTEESFG